MVAVTKQAPRPTLATIEGPSRLPTKPPSTSIVANQPMPIAVRASPPTSGQKGPRAAATRIPTIVPATVPMLNGTNDSPACSGVKPSTFWR
ncbi:hypothetical protein FQZ97_1121130 [compost metagenome]